MTPQKRQFVDEYILNARNGTQAAIAAGYAEHAAKQTAYRLLHEPLVIEYLEQQTKAMQERTGITHDRVLEALWGIATADSNDLIEYRRVNCRYCWGDNHDFQMTPKEMERHEKEHVNACRVARSGNKPEPEFDPLGGIGYNGNRPANPECPECFGLGVGLEVVKDTRFLPPTVKALYAGVERTKGGVKLKMHAKVQALELIGRHLGMWNNKLKLQGDKENPLTILYEQIKGNRPAIYPSVGGKSSLPVSEDDE